MSITVDNLAKEVYVQYLLTRKQFIEDREAGWIGDAPYGVTIRRESTVVAPPGVDKNVITAEYNKAISSDPADQTYAQGTFLYKKIRKGAENALAIFQTGIPDLSDPAARTAYIETIAEAFQNGVSDVSGEFLNDPSLYTDTQQFMDDGRLSLVEQRAQMVRKTYAEILIDAELVQHKKEQQHNAEVALNYYTANL